MEAPGESGEGGAGAGPTVFHITHWKAGSQWVRGVLTAAWPGRIVPIRQDMSHVLGEPIRPGGIYTPVYLNRDRFCGAVRAEARHRRFVVIRDLRDALVSYYFSLTISHPANREVDEFRRRLAGMSVEDGLIHLINGPLADFWYIQTTWLSAGERVFRYEDMLADELGAFARILEHCGLEVPGERLRAIVAANSFARVTGRSRGQEDPAAHRRKGIVGDWRNHFTPQVSRAFKGLFGEHLVETGYERGLDW